MTLDNLFPPQTNFNPLFTGRIGVAIGIATVISLVTLGLLYSGFPIFGPINDITNAVGGLLSALLVWQFHAMLRERAPLAATILLIVAWAGSAAIIINSILVAAGRMHWMTGGMYTALGYGLLGVWLFGLARLIGAEAILTPGLLRLGTIAGIALLFGLLAGPLLISSVELQNNPAVWIAYAGAAGGWLLYPVWCWLVGRQLLSL